MENTMVDFIKHKKLLLIAAIAGSGFFSCNKKNLDQPALGYLDESKLENKEGLEGLLIGAYSMLDGMGANPLAQGGSGSNWIFGSICGSEAYKGSNPGDLFEIESLENFTPTATNTYLAGKWLAVYTGVQRTNAVLRVLQKTTLIEKEDSQRIAAEARFLRGHYHFEAIKVWNKVPYVDETITYESGNFRLGNDLLIWPEIENDFKYAMNILRRKWMLREERINMPQRLTLLRHTFFKANTIRPGLCSRTSLQMVLPRWALLTPC